MSSFRSLAGSAVLFVMLWSSAPHAEVAGTTVSVSDLKTMVSGLGLTPHSDGKTSVSIYDQGKEGVTITLVPVADGKFVLFYTSFGEVPADVPFSIAEWRSRTAGKRRLNGGAGSPLLLHGLMRRGGL